MPLDKVKEQMEANGICDYPDDAVQTLYAEVKRLTGGLYPLGKWTPQQSLALADDIGASEDSLLVDWIRRGQRIDRVKAALRSEVGDPDVSGRIVLGIIAEIVEEQ